ncbi:MAG: hypothetical protein ACRD2B_01795 [Terriglobia bacterium]
MKPDLLQLTSLLDGRLQALRDLAREIEAGQQALILLDVQRLQLHDSQKERICAHVRRLDREIAGTLSTLAPQKSLRGLADEIEASRNEPRAASELMRLLDESRAAGVDVAKLNKAYGEFLCRSRRTVKILTNVVFHCLGLYPPPLTSLRSVLGRSY